MRNSKAHLGLIVGVLTIGVGSFLAVAAVRASSNATPAGATRVRSASDALPPGLQRAAQAAGLALNTSRNIGASLYLVNRGGGDLCLVNASHGMSMGCAPQADFFGGTPVRWGMSEAGPSSAPTDLTLAGVARADVAQVRVVFPSGAISATPNADGGFSVHADEATLKAGRPTQLIVIGKSGKTIETDALPQS